MRYVSPFAPLSIPSAARPAPERSLVRRRPDLLGCDGVRLAHDRAHDSDVDVTKEYGKITWFVPSEEPQCDPVPPAHRYFSEMPHVWLVVHGTEQRYIDWDTSDLTCSQEDV